MPPSTVQRASDGLANYSTNLRPAQARPAPLAEVSELALAEVGGRGRHLVLRGPALPHADGTRVPGETRLQTRRYGNRVLQRVIGHHYNAVTYAGEWVDAALAQSDVPAEWFEGDRPARQLRTAAELEWALEELRLGGELLHLSSPQGDELRGRIGRADYGRGQRGCRAWEFEFVPVESARATPAASSASSREDIDLGEPPSSAARRMADAVGGALNPLEWFQRKLAVGARTLQDAFDGLRNGPIAFLKDGSDTFQQALRILEHGIVGLARLGGDVNGALVGYREGWDRAAALGETTLSAGRMLGWSCEELCPARLAVSDEPAAQFAAAEELGGALALARAAAAESARLHRQARLSARRDEPAPQVHYLGEDEDLRDVAARYYGDPDLWHLIATENGLSGYNLPPGRRLVIPRRQSP